MHVPKEKWRKLDAKAEKCILVGYSEEQMGYKCYNPPTKQARVSRDVVFDESASWYLLLESGEATSAEEITQCSAVGKSLRM